MPLSFFAPFTSTTFSPTGGSVENRWWSGPLPPVASGRVTCAISTPWTSARSAMVRLPNVGVRSCSTVMLKVRLAASPSLSVAFQV